MLTVSKTSLENVLLLQLDHREDHRGTYTRLYQTEEYTKIIKEYTGQKIEFLEDDFAASSRNVLRGIHGDDRTWKLITCLFGKFYIVIVNCKKDSSNFGKWQNFILTYENGKQLLVPPKHGNGYQILSSHAVLHYKQSCSYLGKTQQFTYKWNEPLFNIWWPIKNPILSLRDELGYVP